MSGQFLFFPAILKELTLFSFNVGSVSLWRAHSPLMWVHWRLMWVRACSYCQIMWAQIWFDCGSSRLSLRAATTNLLLVRSVLGEEQYSDFESMIEFHLVGKIFASLDNCLTKTYDFRIKNNKSGETTLSNCNASELIQQALDCGYALTDELYKLTEQKSKGQREKATSIVYQRCPK